MRNRWTQKAGSYLFEMQTKGQNTMEAFSNNIKLLASILIAVAILFSSGHVSAWAAVVAGPGYAIMLLNDELAGPDGLDVIWRLVADSPERLGAGGKLILEIGAGQAGEVERCIRQTRGLTFEKIEKDLAGIPRVAVAAKD